MSKEGVRKAIGKLLSDNDFNQNFLVNPEEALRDLDLTEAERSALAEIDLATFGEQQLVISRDIEAQAVKVHSITIFAD